MIESWNLDDWDFSKADTKYYTHGLHNYPARMIPQIAKRLILNFSDRDNRILDPFMGSGTVILESALNNRYSTGIDLNPLAILIAKVKVTPINPDKLDSVFTRLKISIPQTSIQEVADVLPKFQNIEYWFKDYVIQDLTKIRIHIDECAQEVARGYRVRARDGQREPPEVYHLTHLLLSWVLDPPRRFQSGYDASDPRVRRLMEALIDAQSEDGGWRPFWAEESSAVYTVLAIEVLILSGMLAREDLQAGVEAYAA